MGELALGISVALGSNDGRIVGTLIIKGLLIANKKQSSAKEKIIFIWYILIYL